jgi:hypothetical protein
MTNSDSLMVGVQHSSLEREKARKLLNGLDASGRLWDWLKADPPPSPGYPSNIVAASRANGTDPIPRNATVANAADSLTQEPLNNEENERREDFLLSPSPGSKKAHTPGFSLGELSASCDVIPQQALRPLVDETNNMIMMAVDEEKSCPYPKKRSRAFR